MNPWMIIGWIVLAVMVAALSFCGMIAYGVADLSGVPRGRAPVSPVGSAEIVEIRCGAAASIVEARNTSNRLVSGMTATVSWGPGMTETLELEPRHVGAGATARGTGAGWGDDCRVTSLKDEHGRNLTR